MPQPLTMEQIIREVDSAGWRFMCLHHIRGDNLWSCIFERRARDSRGLPVHASAMDLTAMEAMLGALSRVRQLDAAGPPPMRTARGVPPDDKRPMPPAERVRLEAYLADHASINALLHAAVTRLEAEHRSLLECAHDA